MTIHIIVTKEDEQINVDLANNCGSWSWRKVDKYGMYDGKTSEQFDTQDGAKQNALEELGGDHFLK